MRLDAAATSAIDAFHVCPSLDILVPTLIEHGAEKLHEHIALTPGKHWLHSLCYRTRPRDRAAKMDFCRQNY